MVKKFLALMSITTLAASITACGGSGQTASSSTTPSASTAPIATVDTNKPKPEFKALLQYARFDPNAEVVAKFLNEKTGYKVTYDMLPVENPDDKLNLLMANKEKYGFMLLSGPQYSRLSSSGALEPIDELVNKYGTNMKNVISQNSWNGAKLNGKIYGIPQTGSGTIVNTAGEFVEYVQVRDPRHKDAAGPGRQVRVGAEQGFVKCLLAEVAGQVRVCSGVDEKFDAGSCGSLPDQAEAPALFTDCGERQVTGVLEVDADGAGVEHRFDRVLEETDIVAAATAGIAGFNVRRHRKCGGVNDPLQCIHGKPARQPVAVRKAQAPGNRGTGRGDRGGTGFLHQPGGRRVPHVDQDQRNAAVPVERVEGCCVVWGRRACCHWSIPAREGAAVKLPTRRVDD